MKIELNRLLSNNLYTEGQLIVNGANFCNSLEHTFSMLHIGEYKVQFKKVSKKHRVIAIFPNLSALNTQHSTLNAKQDDLHIIDHGSSWKDSLSHNAIIIGTPMIPGAVKCSQELYNLLYERMKKCQTEVTLIIRDNNCKENTPISQWL